MFNELELQQLIGLKMRIRDLQEKHGVPGELIEVIEGSGINELYPPQAEAIEKGVLEGSNLVLAIPTAAGKTLIAELCMLTSILKENGMCLYTVPLRALASEKFEEFKEKYESLGVNVGVATGDYDVSGSELADYDILVATSEKVDSLLRHKAKWLADLSTVAVFDEIHLIDEPGRGPTLEVLAARLSQLNPDLQILGLSATISNSSAIADWLEANHVKSEWRPVPLKEGVFLRGDIFFEDLSEQEVKTSAKDRVSKIAADTIEQGEGQVLVFVSTRKSTQVAARRTSNKIQEYLTEAEKKELEEVAHEIETA
ncbi:MAG: DEAD/DEAH box helicase, partial [Hadesarchaea archaeon]|nr:DEAD/DEAH box helicase [Hadesarchaea archaeon]